MKLKQGDIIKTNFTPQAGHEQAGYRPAVVISNKSFHAHNKMTIVCPITHTDSQNPFHIKLEGYNFVDGFIMCDQIRSIDLRVRGCKYLGKLTYEDVETVNGIFEMIFEKEIEEPSLETEISQTAD